MRSSVKNKIRAGSIFLFLLVVLSAGFSIYYLVRLKSQSENILKANYESLQYANRMQLAIDSVIAGESRFIDSIGLQLKKQQNNLTEPGESIATGNLTVSFQKLKAGDMNATQEMRFQLHEIIKLNMAGMLRKSLASNRSMEEAMTYLITIISIILLIGFTFVFNFPSIITNPIRKFADAIKEITGKNYKHRIHIESKDEFGDLAAAFNEMAERLEFFESSNLNKLIFEKTRAEAVINSLKDASIGVDKNNLVLFANDQALQLLGLSARDIVGMNVSDVEKNNDLFRFLLQERSVAPFKIVVNNKENYFTREVIEVSQDGSASSKVIVLRNITPFKELDVAKTNFIATISHELKTPLSSSDFSLKLLEDERVGKLSSEQKELIQHLKEDNRRMLKILSELLNLSQIESGKIKLSIQSINPRDIVKSSIEAVETRTKEKNIEIIQDVDLNLAPINADGDKLIWVLNNLLTNAIKHSPENDKITISVKPVNNCISFAVSDHGNGIEEKYLEEIFERYFQVPGRPDIRGTGIGLAISKDFIEAMGGKIWVRSHVGQGSTFGFDFPY
jgi:NtrC-family two-component system sensor histidine kinase KinB